MSNIKQNIDRHIQIHYTVQSPMSMTSKILQLQKTLRLPQEWLLPQEVHCISSDRNYRSQQT